ncbi:MAG: hypothetical protein KAU06_01585 [Candidatus Marinimicrobia bacterium]|nr:hypothetical protein [Candidatus Neomarinimicrobiota bacterium]
MKKYFYCAIMILFLFSSNLFAQVITEGVSAPGILDSQIPDVEVVYPNGGEVFQVDDLINIQWTAADSSFGLKPVSVYFSSNNGTSFQVIYSDTVNTSPILWSVPNIATLEGLIRIVAVDSFGLAGNDTSDAVFKIDGPPAQPDGLAASLTDHVINLSWNTVDEDDMDKYRIYRSMNPVVETNSDNLIDSVSAPVIVYADSNVIHGETYYYVITALDSLGNESIASSEVSETAYILQITSVTFQQRKDGSKLVDVDYVFVGNPLGTYTITPYYSIDSGDNWLECSLILDGDTGSNIAPGTYSMEWDFGSQLGGIYQRNAMIKIIGAEDQIPEKSAASKTGSK